MATQVRSFTVTSNDWYGPYLDSGANQDHIGRLFFTAFSGIRATLRDGQVEVKYRYPAGQKSVTVPVSAGQERVLREEGALSATGQLTLQRGFDAQLERYNGQYSLVLQNPNGLADIHLSVDAESGQPFFDNSSSHGPHLWKTRYLVASSNGIEGQAGTRVEVDIYEPPHLGLAVARFTVEEGAPRPDVDWIGEEITDSPELPDAIIAAKPVDKSVVGELSGAYRSL